MAKPTEIEKQNMTKRLEKILTKLQNGPKTREQAKKITEIKRLILKRQLNGECYKIL